jgi:hypothetical protein
LTVQVIEIANSLHNSRNRQKITADFDFVAFFGEIVPLLKVNPNRILRASFEMKCPPTEAVSVADAVTPFDSHERGSEQSDQLFLSAGIREHLRLGQGEGAASFHHAATGKDALACGGS